MKRFIFPFFAFSLLFGLCLEAKSEVKIESKTENKTEGNSIVIRLTETAEVSLSTIKLKDIALVEKCQVGQKGEILETAIAISPTVGKIKTLYPYQIQAALEKKGIYGVAIFGPYSQVALKVKKLSSDDLKALVWTKVHSILGKDKDIEMRFLRVVDSWSIPEASQEIEVSSLSQRLSGNVTFNLRVMSGEQVIEATQVKTYISLYEPVATLKKVALREEKIASDAVTFERQEVTKLDGMQIASYKEIENLVAKRDLPKGTLLKKSDFEQPLTIKRGDLCRIIVMNGPVRMAIAGAAALQNGKEGETISFANPMQPGKNLKARCLQGKVALIQIQ